MAMTIPPCKLKIVFEYNPLKFEIPARPEALVGRPTSAGTSGVSAVLLR